MTWRIFRFIRRDQRHQGLRDRLEQAHEQRRVVRGEASEVADLADRLRRHLERNQFAERLIAQIDISRR